MTLEELKALLRALPEPALVLSGEGTVLASNRAACRALALPAAELEGRPWVDLVQRPEGLADYLRDCARSLEPVLGAFARAGPGEAHFQCEGARLGVALEGSRVLVLLRFRPRLTALNQFVVLNERLHQLTAEVKRRREAEAALRESEERFRLLAEAVPQLVWVVRSGGQWVYVNSRWCDFTGLRLEEVQGEGWARALHPEDAPGALEAWWRSLATGEPFQGEYRLRHAATGAWHWFLGRALPNRDDSGGGGEWFGTWTDIDAQKRVEQAAVQAIGVRDEFLSVAAHELKTPLTSLKLQLELLGRALGAAQGTQAPVLGNRLQAAQRQVSRLNALNDSLLDVSRLDSGQLSLELRPVDLSQLVRDCVERLEGEFTRVGCALTLDVQPGVIGQWDALRLEQVVVNLLTNAAKYGAGGPVALALWAEGGSVRLRVRDSGIGIPPEAQERIFQKFERAVSVQHYGGLGLGLYISRQIIEALGGRISVESTPGAGATFTVQLPHAETLSDEGGAASTSGPAPRGPWSTPPKPTGGATRGGKCASRHEAVARGRGLHTECAAPERPLRVRGPSP